MEYLWLALKLMAGFTIPLILFVLYRLKIKGPKDTAFYEKQGITFFKGCDTGLGNLDLGTTYFKYIDENPDGVNFVKYVLDQAVKTRGYSHYDAADYPLVGMKLIGRISILVADPEVVQDIFTSKSQYVDKFCINEVVFTPLMGKSLLFMSGDDLWKTRRQANAHAFYKDKLASHTEVVKGQVDKEFSEWEAEIDKSEDGSHIIDLSEVFQKILQKNIVTICFGEDITEHKLKLYMPLDRKASKVEEQTVSFRLGLRSTFETLAQSTADMLSSPKNWIFARTKQLYPVTEVNKKIYENCRRLREFTRNYIHERQAGKRKSSLEDNADLLSMFFQNPEVFDEEYMINQLFDYFIAGVMTTQASMQTSACHFAKNQQTVQNVRAEFDQIRNDSKLSDKPLEEQLKGLVNIDCVGDLEYLSWVIKESLRMQPPVPTTTRLICLDDFKAGGKSFKKDTQFQINIQGLHYNSKEWPNPNEFIAERFDATSPHYLNAEGKKRHNMSYVPFYAGKRVCLGQTLSQVNSKVILTYMTQYFDLAFVEPEKYEHFYPMAYVMQPAHKPILAKVTRRKV